jgi:hypothetical protein
MMTGAEANEAVREMDTRSLVRIIMAPNNVGEKMLRCQAAFELGRRVRELETQRYCAECRGAK